MKKEMADMRTLISIDGELIPAHRDALRQSAVLDAFADAALPGQTIPVANIGGEVLRKIITYCTRHMNRPAVYEPEDARELTVTPWCRKFIDGLEPDMLSHIITSAYYLDIPPLVSLGCKAYAKMMWASKTLAEMVDWLGLDIELPPERPTAEKLTDRKKSKSPQKSPTISRKKLKSVVEAARSTSS